MRAKKTLEKPTSELVERKRRRKPDFWIGFQKKADLREAKAESAIP